MKENRSNTLLLTVIGVATLLVAVIGASFAYFTAKISGSETATTVTVGAGTLAIAYSGGGGALVSTEPLEPITDGTPVISKTFTITGNNSTAAVMPYTIKIVVLGNSFTSNTLKYSLDSTNTGGNGYIVPDKAETGIATGASNITLGTGYFSGVVTSSVHTYILNIYFPDTEVNQDVDKNKEFTAYVETTVEQIYTTTPAP
ncbi:MAG: hypothetical protein PHF30_02575 [Bacilli bacterium]|nr:hypothetical protein [Bacilli bacterium]